MKINKQNLWLVVSGLMALSLVMAGCAPATTQPSASIPTPAATSTAPTEPITPSVPVSPVQQMPQQGSATNPTTLPTYGGVFTYQASNPSSFDFAVLGQAPTMALTNSLLLTGDWSKGPAGTGETAWQFGIVGQTNMYYGDLATSWDITLPDTITFHLRKGVMWQNKPPVNGRELTADDVVYTLNRLFITDREFAINGAYTDNASLAKSIKALDKYTVQVKIVSERFGNMLNWMGAYTPILPHEVYEKYGDMKDWKNAEGTGPWMLADYVPSSSTTFVRNPNYFMNDPLHQDNKLPYMDKVVWLVIPDASTQQAAFRTGKLDRMTGVTADDQSLFMKQNPKFKYSEKLNSAPMPVGREDKNLPFKDVRVRQALNMAVDKQAILDHFYGGHGVLFAEPVPPTPEHSKLFTPLNQEPQIVQDLFTYNPDKAKQLLKDAGYPNGFQTEIITTAANVDFLAIVQSDLAKVGVDMAIKVLDNGSYTSQWKNMTFAQMMTGGAYQWNYASSMATFAPGSDNPACFNFDNSDALVNAAYKIVPANVGINTELWQSTLKALYPHILEQAQEIWMPAYYTYTMWWPWVGNYHGELNVGYSESSRFLQYIWIDGALKTSMGY